MNVTILGAGGFVGRKLAAALPGEAGRLILLDMAAPPPPPGRPDAICLAGDVADLPAEAIPPGTDVVFHLAAVVSSAAEADYELGRRVNIGGVMSLIDRCRALAEQGGRPVRVVFTGSVASFGGGQSAVLGDDARQVPSNSYGTQKAIGEMLLSDATRRGFLDAVSIRLPTVVIRPGRPNKAASSFVSAIVREPLLGLPTTLPVDEAFAVWVCSPRRAVDWLLHAARMPTAGLGLDRTVNPPGLRVTVGEMLDALEAVRPGARALVEPSPDAAIAAIVEGWPAAFQPDRALRLGFAPHEPLETVIASFIEDDLESTRAER